LTLLLCPFYAFYVAEVRMKDMLGTGCLLGSGWVLTSACMPPLVHLGM